MDDSYNGRQKCGELAVKFDFPPTPSPLNNVDFSFFLGMTDHSAYITLNWWGRGVGVGDVRALTLDANKIEQMLKYFSLKCLNYFCRPL